MTLRTLMTGVSGLRAESEAIDVVSDNIANANTWGFKRQRAIFEDILGRSAFTEGSGAGVRNAHVQQEYSQGALITTGVTTDLAITGDGFFAVSGSVNGLAGVFYTRGGNFSVDADGYLVDTARLQLLGYAAQPDETFAASVSPLRVPTAAIAPNPTTNATVTANLDATTPSATTAWSASDPSNTSDFSTTMTVYDSLGAAHSMNVYFAKTADSTWNYHVTVRADETSNSVAATGDEFVEVGSGTLTFNQSGALVGDTVSTPVSPAFLGASAQTIALDFGAPLSTDSSGFEGVTQFASPSNVSSQNQNGYASGSFSGIAIDGTGTVLGKYDNGESLAIGRLAVAKFRSNEGLARAGETLWLDTDESGQAALGTAGSGGRGEISAGAVEASNVDMAQEMVGLITHQRAYGANSKVITAADDMLAELMTIKK